MVMALKKLSELFMVQTNVVLKPKQKQNKTKTKQKNSDTFPEKKHEAFAQDKIFTPKFQ